MLIDENEPRPAGQTALGLPLDRLGIDELNNYILALRAEIVRVEGEIAKKSDHRSVADQYFRPRG